MADTTKPFVARSISLAPASEPEWITMEVDGGEEKKPINLKTLDCHSLALGLLALSVQQARQLAPESVLESVQAHFDKQMLIPVEALGARYNEQTGELLVTTGIGMLRFVLRPESQAEAKAWLQSL